MILDGPPVFKYCTYPTLPTHPLSTLAPVYRALSYWVRTLRVRALSITVQAGHLASGPRLETLFKDTRRGVMVRSPF